MNEYASEVERLAKLAQSLINGRYAAGPNNEAFEQAGILNGESTVIDYLKHGELAVALEHLLYMVHEAGISFAEDEHKNILSIASELGIESSYVNQKD